MCAAGSWCHSSLALASIIPDPSEDSKLEQEINVSVKDMTFIKDNLTRAEASRRKGETAAVYECYNSLAEYFQTQKDSKTGVYFYEKCLEISRLTGDVSGEMAANKNLGSAYETLGNVKGAIRYHERHLEIATSRDDAIEQRNAHTQLVNVYRKHAEALEAAGQYNEAAELHMRCLLSAQACGDRLAEGLANYRTGRVHVLLQEPQKAVPYLENYVRHHPHCALAALSCTLRPQQTTKKREGKKLFVCGVCSIASWN